MALRTKVGSFNTGTGAAGTTINVTVGFQPKAIIFWWSGRTETVDTVARANSHVGIGFGVSDTLRWNSAWSREDGAAAEAGVARASRDSIIFRMTTAGVGDGSMDLSAIGSWPSDGFQTVVDVQFGASMRIHYFAIGGADITNTTIQEFQMSLAAVGTDVDVVNAGFQPDIIFVSTASSNVGTASVTNAILGFGAAISAAKQAQSSIMYDIGSATGDGGQYCLEGPEFLARQGNSDPIAVTGRYDFLQMLSNGFRYNVLEATTAGNCAYLAIKGGVWDLGSLLTQTDTTTDIVSAPALGGAIPAGLLFTSACRAESTVDAGTTPTRWSFGAATSASEEAAMAEHGEQGSASTRVGTAVEHDASYVNLADIAADPDAQTIQGSMHVTATAPNSFTCRMTDADPAQNFVWWVAVAEPLRPLGQFFPDWITELVSILPSGMRPPTS